MKWTAALALFLTLLAGCAAPAIQPAAGPDPTVTAEGDRLPTQAAVEKTAEAEETAAPDEPTKPASAASDGWSIYRSTELGYSFAAPPETIVEPFEDPANGVTITGPVKDSETWPWISVGHPRNRAEFRPAEGADLPEWLEEHYLLGETRMPDVEIAGTTAVHLRHDRSPQSYANDRFFFAHAGQLYEIVILHAGDREDWELYNRFLASFVFEE